MDVRFAKGKPAATPLLGEALDALRADVDRAVGKFVEEYRAKEIR